MVDASAFPFLPPGHSMSTVYALAEKIAGDVMVEDGMGEGEAEPGYSMEGYYRDQQLFMEYAANLSESGGGGGAARAQTGGAGPVQSERVSWVAEGMCVVMAWMNRFP